jgi:WhiB family redox-sensing transcriptional regulator
MSIIDFTPIAEPWMEGAVCTQTDPEVFFPERAERVKASAAKAICRRCPVRDACLEWALDNGERFGVWGGTSETDRRRLRREGRNGNALLAIATAEATGAA